MAVIVGVDVKVVSDAVVQHVVAILEVVQDAQDGAVVIVRRQWSQTNVHQGDILTLICGDKTFDVKLQVQHLDGEVYNNNKKERRRKGNENQWATDWN